jgi:hypothetical protein
MKRKGGENRELKYSLINPINPIQNTATESVLAISLPTHNRPNYEGGVELPFLIKILYV